MNLNYKNTMQTTVETGDIWLLSVPDKRFAEINTIRDVKYSTSCEHYLCWKEKEEKDEQEQKEKEEEKEEREEEQEKEEEQEEEEEINMVEGICV